MIRTRTKICGITRPEDARVAIDQGADALGLVFYPPSPRSVNLEQAVSLTRSLPPFVTITALFVNPDAEVVRNLMNDLPIGLLQFHGDESASFCEQFGAPYIKALRVKPGLNIGAAEHDYASAQALLLDAYHEQIPGGTGRTFEWSLIPKNLTKPIILAGGLNADNVCEAIRQVAPYAVDVSGGVERSKGIKDPQKILAFMHEVQRADKN